MRRRACRISRVEGGCEPPGRRLIKKPNLGDRSRRSLLWATSSAPVGRYTTCPLDAPRSPDTSAGSAEELMERYVAAKPRRSTALSQAFADTMGYLLR